MPTCRTIRVHNAIRVGKSAAARKAAGDAFRQRHLDNLLKKQLKKSYPQAESSYPVTLSGSAEQALQKSYPQPESRYPVTLSGSAEQAVADDG